MIRVHDVLRDVPSFESFCSVEKLHRLVDGVRADPRFSVEEVGTSVNGVPIHHLRYGQGAVRALVVAGPHAPEAVGGLTVFSLITLLQQRHPGLANADVEWHIVPCIDPDGAILNEGWSLAPFSIANYRRHFYLQSPRDQVDTSFPVSHKKLLLNAPSQEAKILRGVIDRSRPDFFFTLHNASFGGAFCFVNRDIGQPYYTQIHQLVRDQGLVMQAKPLWKEMCAPYAQGIVEMWTVRKYYDFLEKTSPSPEKSIHYGAGSWDYVEEVNPGALVFVTEAGYVRHPRESSNADTGQNLRQFLLRLDADRRYLGSMLVEEWDKIKDQVDTASPFYRATVDGRLIPTREDLVDGKARLSRYPMSDALFNPDYARNMTEADRVSACLDGVYFLTVRSQVIRLLKASPQTQAICLAAERLERAFEEALDQLDRLIDFSAMESISHGTLARVQLGSGLVALNSLLAQQGHRA